MKLIIDPQLIPANTAIKIEDVTLLLTHEKALATSDEHIHTSILLDLITYQLEERALFNISPNLN